MIELHRKTIEVMDRHGIDYPHANVLGKGPNRSHRNINHTICAAVIVVAMSLLALIFG